MLPLMLLKNIYVTIQKVLLDITSKFKCLIHTFRFDITQLLILKVKSSYANESYIKIAKLFKCSDIISQLLFILWCNIT